ncbi:MAG TPA: hypothetical protein VF572_00580 [Candidatus Saccharimonadales bacterium]|jgi:hypothetical protein
MPNSYRTPYDDKPYQPDNSRRRYATAAVVLSGVLVGGSAISSYASNHQTNYGRPFTYNGQQYYVPNDSRRAVYPSQEACYQDVPWDRQAECEPTSNYAGSGGSGGGFSGGSWYGPVYNPRDSYQPSGRYPTETADINNMGKRLPKGANPDGFGANGKAFTGSKGG